MQSNLRAKRWGCILIGGPRNVTSAVQASLKKRHETREQLMEEKRPYDAKQVVILKRKVQWTRHEFWLAPDPRHVKDIVEELGLTQAQPADTPMLVSQSSKAGRSLPDLSARSATLCRRQVAKENYSAMDRPDNRHAASIASVSKKKKDILKLKRVGPLFIGGPNTWTHCRGRCNPTASCRTPTATGRQIGMTSDQ